MEREIILKVIEVGLPLIFGFISGYWIQKLKNRPRVITHNCRISGKDVYTYFDSSNKSSRPSCPFLSISGDCDFLKSKEYPRTLMISPTTAMDIGEAERLLKLHEGKCYLVQWNK